MWKDIIDILINVYKSYSGKKKENSEKLSKIFDQISEIIDSCIEHLRRDEYPHNHCQIMAALSKDLVNELSHMMDMNKLKELESLLISASNLEIEYANRKKLETRNVLESASARFKSLSILYS